MNTNIPLTKYQTFMEKLAWYLTVFTIGATLVRFHALPYRVPTHFDITGQPDAYGERSMVFLLLGAMILVCVLTSIANRAPLRWVNLPFEVREGREEAVLTAVRDMSVTVQVEAVLLMLSIQSSTLFMAQLPNPLVMGITAVLMVTIAVGIWRSWKANTAV